MPTRPVAACKKSQKTVSNGMSSASLSSSRKNTLEKSELERLLMHTTQEAEMRMRHHLFAALNVGQCSVEGYEELQEFPSYRFSVPCPINIAQKHCEDIDPCYVRTLTRATYNRRLLNARTRYLMARKRNRNYRSLERENVYHTSFYDFVERIEKNSDAYFNGSYDYYYTGGNIRALADGDTLIHVNGKGLTNINVSSLPAEFGVNAMSTSCMCSHSIDSQSEIFEVQPLTSLSEKHTNMFAVRQRNAVVLLSVHPSERIKVLTDFKSNITPFISFTQSPVHAHQFAIGTMKQKVRLYDLRGSTPALYSSYNLYDNDDKISWNTIRAWREHTYIYANKNSLRLIDTRTKSEEWMKTKCQLSSNEFKCEFISSVAASDFLNHIYIGTAHKLHCLDVRHLPKSFEADNAICRWIHQLEYPPSFIDTYRSGSKELIALASAKAGDLRICELARTRQSMKNVSLSSQKLVYKSYTMPYQPPTLGEAYESARLKGKCLQPDSGLKDRIRCCTTGLTFYEKFKTSADSEIVPWLLTANSNGDVYAYKLSESDIKSAEPRTNSISDEMMSEYESKISQLKEPDLCYSDVVDMAALSKVLRCSTFNASLENVDKFECDEKKLIASKKRNVGRWQKSAQTLHSYKDALVKDLLAIWDVDYEKEDNMILSHLQIKSDTSILVNNWLTQNDTSQPPMTSVPMESLLTMDSLIESHSEFPQSQTMKDADEITMQMEDTLNNVHITKTDSISVATKKKNRTFSKKKSYVKGF